LTPVTVLMPVLNGGEYLYEAVCSILNQDFLDFELLVIDDNSTDNTPEILANLLSIDSRIRTLTNVKNLGIAQSLNIGIANARGSYIARMDADDISDKERLKIQYNEFSRNECLVMVGSNVLHVTNDGNPIYPTNFPLNDWAIRWTYIFSNPFAHPSVMIKKSALEQVGGYNTDFVVSQDYELWGRLMDRGDVLNVGKRLVCVRRHSDSISTVHKSAQLRNTARIQKDYVSRFLPGYECQQDNLSHFNRSILFSEDDGLSLRPDAKKIIDFVAEIIDAKNQQYPGHKVNEGIGLIIGRVLVLLMLSPNRLVNICGFWRLIRQNRGSLWLGLRWVFGYVGLWISVLGFWATISNLSVHIRNFCRRKR